MATNLTVPLFQQQDSLSKMISLAVRGGWVWIGGMFSMIVIIPVVIYGIIVSVLPIVILFMLLYSVLNLTVL